MGCDIHGMYERKGRWSWVNAGDPDIGRNYTTFAILADVRNEGGIPPISQPRLSFDEIADWDFDVSDEFRALTKHWSSDGHSHSYVTLKELKAYDINQKYYSHRLITSKDDEGRITGTCAMTTGKHLGEVGETSIFGVFGSESWDKFVAYGEAVAKQFNLTDEEVRFVFFFDN